MVRSATSPARGRGAASPGRARESTPRSSATACLATIERGDGRVVQPLRHPLAHVGPVPGERAHQGRHLVVLPQLDQARDGVQPVVELVRLRAQGVGDRQVRAELALQRHQLGAVAQRGDGADAAAAGRRATAVEDDDPGADQRHRVPYVGALAGQQRDHVRVQAELVDRAADRVRVGRRGRAWSGRRRSSPSPGRRCRRRRRLRGSRAGAPRAGRRDWPAPSCPGRGSSGAPCGTPPRCRRGRAGRRGRGRAPGRARRSRPGRRPTGRSPRPRRSPSRAPSARR